MMSSNNKRFLGNRPIIPAKKVRKKSEDCEEDKWIGWYRMVQCRLTLGHFDVIVALSLTYSNDDVRLTKLNGSLGVVP